MSSEQQQRIIGYFIEEAKDHLNTIEQGLLNLQGTIEDPEMASEIFRAAHSVKGGAAMLGLSSIQQTSHRLEDYFKVLKECPVRVDQRLETLLLRVFDTLQELLENLQGPFGLTDDKASEVMSEVEPVFDALNQHLNNLVNQCGGVPPEDVELTPKAAPAMAIPAAPRAQQPVVQEESALQLIFQSDVPARLREMLQLFKQPDDASSRQQLQNTCRTLIMAGEQFDLPEWCSLMETARQAIASPDNNYRTLAPIIIKEIKHAQEQVLSGQPAEIKASDSLLQLVPQIVETEEPDFADLLTEMEFEAEEPSTFSDFNLAFDNLESSQLNQQPEMEEAFFGSEESTASPFEAEEFSSDRLSEEPQDWFETASDFGQEAEFATEPNFSVNTDNDSEFDSINLDFAELLEQEASSAPTTERNGPEVGMAELNSLADLFEGEVPELGMTWQEEEIVSDASNSYSAPELDASNDFSDLFFEPEASEDLSLDIEDEDLSGLLSNSELMLNQVTNAQIEETSLTSELEFSNEAGDSFIFSIDEHISEEIIETETVSASSSDRIGTDFNNLDALFGDLDEADFGAGDSSNRVDEFDFETSGDLDAIFAAPSESSAVETDTDASEFNWDSEIETGDRFSFEDSEPFSNNQLDELSDAPSLNEDFYFENDFSLTSLDELNALDSVEESSEGIDDENIFTPETPTSQANNWFVQPDVETASSSSTDFQWEDSEVTSDLWDESDESEPSLTFDDAGILENDTSASDGFFTFDSDITVSNDPSFDDAGILENDISASDDFFTFDSDITVSNDASSESEDLNLDLPFNESVQTDELVNLDFSVEADDIPALEGITLDPGSESDEFTLFSEAQSLEQDRSQSPESPFISENPLFEANLPEFSPLEGNFDFEPVGEENQFDAVAEADLTVADSMPIEPNPVSTETSEPNWFAADSNDSSWDTQIGTASEPESSLNDLFGEDAQAEFPAGLEVEETVESSSALDGDFSAEFDNLFAEDVFADDRTNEAFSLLDIAQASTSESEEVSNEAGDRPVDLETDLDDLFSSSSLADIGSDNEEFAAADSEFAEFEAELGGLFAEEADVLEELSANSVEPEVDANQPDLEVVETDLSALEDQSDTKNFMDFEWAMLGNEPVTEPDFSEQWNEAVVPDSSSTNSIPPATPSEAEPSSDTPDLDLDLGDLFGADSEALFESAQPFDDAVAPGATDLDLADLFDDDVFSEVETGFGDRPDPSDESADINLPTESMEESLFEDSLPESTETVDFDFGDFDTAFNSGSVSSDQVFAEAELAEVQSTDAFDFNLDEAVSSPDYAATETSSADDFSFDLEETASSSESEADADAADAFNLDSAFAATEALEVEPTNAEIMEGFDTGSSELDEMMLGFEASDLTDATESSDAEESDFDEMMLGFEPSDLTNTSEETVQPTEGFDIESSDLDEMMLGFEPSDFTNTLEEAIDQTASSELDSSAFDMVDMNLGLETESQESIDFLPSEDINLPETEASANLTDTDTSFDALESLLNDDEMPISRDTLIFDKPSVSNDLDSGLTDGVFGTTSAIPELDDFSDLEALLGDEPLAAMPLPLAPESSPPATVDEFDDLEKLLKDADQKMGGASATRSSRSSANATNRRMSRRNSGIGDQNMRVSVKHLDNLNNLVGELVVNRNSLEQAEERLRQFLDNLLYQVQQLSDVGQRMRDLYERSLLESSLLSSRRSYHLSSQGGMSQPQTNHATGVSFDALEMDRFTGFHTLSQEMIELIVRVRESASDIDFVVDETDQITRIFRQITTQLQEGLTRSRMVPFAQIADRLPRAVRDISLQNGKQAELVVEGRDTLIDKMILEQLYDPMTHLVNNAIAHGIETPEQRQASGKPIVGRITVRAFHQGNQTVISVTDDGAGIDPERVKTKAIEKGLITPAEAAEMTRLDVYDLLFHHGFSTRDKADNIAGRGVGMDVVQTSLTEIRGVINIDSTIGQGTTFTIRLPLTLSISKALCCISNRARIAFPMDGVEDMLDVPKDRIQTDDQGRSCIQWRDMLLPFQPLPDLLKYNRILGRGSVYGGNQEEDIVSVVVLRSNAGNFLALQVDQVLGEQEIVIKQLEGPVPKPTGVAGATVLGDGRIMPIADVLELIDLSLGRIRREAGSSLWDKSDDQAPVETHPSKTEPTVLIVDDSITVRELLSMTFNKVGYRVEQARDGQEAWEKLRSGLPCDLVFCDIEMPRMDGLELLSRIQKDPHLSHLPIAMLTSRGADRHRQMAVQLGAKGYFTKPYLEEALLDAAQRMLKGEVLVTTNG
jgi:chemotaxis protein histidine kinase CheA/CheY-like chemotaxis protein